jgi:hypothetical protein
MIFHFMVKTRRNIYLIDKAQFYFVDYIEFFAPDCQLHPNLFNSKIENGNSRQVNIYLNFSLRDFFLF